MQETKRSQTDEIESQHGAQRLDIQKGSSHEGDAWLKVVMSVAILLLALAAYRSNRHWTPGRQTPQEDEAGDRLAFLVDLNQATEGELSLLPGIGPQLATRIVAYREERGRFQSIDELLQVPGIGPLRLTQIRGFIVSPIASQPVVNGVDSHLENRGS